MLNSYTSTTQYGLKNTGANEDGRKSSVIVAYTDGKTQTRFVRETYVIESIKTLHL